MTKMLVIAAVDAQGRLLGFRRYTRIIARRQGASVSHSEYQATRALASARRGWPSLAFEVQEWNPGKGPNGVTAAPIPQEVVSYHPRTR